MGGDHHRNNPHAEPRAQQDIASLKANKIPLAFRDKCGHLLVDLNKCRRAEMFNPAACGHQRHTYEECEYYAWLDRCAAKKKMEAAAAAAAAL